MSSYRTGEWGNTSSIVNTVGSSDYSCPGLNTEYGKSSEIPFYYNPKSKSRRTTIVIAVCATIGSLLAIAGAILFGLWMRRRILAARWIEDGQDTFPRIFKNPDTIDSPDSFATFERKPPLPRSFATSSTPTTMSTPQTSQSAFYPGSMASPPGILNHPWSLHHAHSSNFSSDSTSKDCGNATTGSPNYLSLPDLPFPPITFKVTRSIDNDDTLQARTSNHNTSTQPHTAEVQPLEPDAEAEIIIQHRSGGGVVQELPPPYLDRSQKRLPPDPSSGSGTEGLAL